MRLTTALLSSIMFLSACGLISGPNKVEKGPLSKNSSNKHFAFDKVPPLKNKRADALRVIIEPSFGRYHYRFDFVPLKAGCKIVDIDVDDMTKYDQSAYCGNVWANGVRTDRKAEQSNVTFRFIVPAEDFRNLFDSVKFGMARWNGSWSGSTDGTSVAVELHNRGKISSFNSNGRSPDNPAGMASIYVKAIALAYGPTGLFPRESDWHFSDDLEDGSPCIRPGLNEHDVDGFGVGDDACAVYLKTALPID